jgi:hypothetical protein
LGHLPVLAPFCGAFSVFFKPELLSQKKLFYKIPSMKSSVMLKRTILPRNLVDRPTRS